jgi:hypothetical protein
MDRYERRRKLLLSNQRKNAHALVNRLPPELLIRILILAREPLLQSYSLCDPRTNPHLKVCHYWRDFMLNTPEYWKDIVFQLSGPGFVEQHESG